MKFLDTPSSPHVHPAGGVTQVMLRVIYALVPGLVAYVYFFGWGVVINIVIAAVVSLGAEALMLALRRRPLRPFLTDASALVTAMLLGASLPPLAPWWLVTIAALFAIVVAKHLYGGLGYNPFNPAMVGYAVVLISFPREMTAWLPPHLPDVTSLGFVDTLRYSLLGHLPKGLNLDAVTMATPLDAMKTQLGLDKTVGEIVAGSPVFGALAGKGWEWINGLYLAGGLWLIQRRVITWQIPAGMLGSLFLLALFFYVGDPGAHASPLFELFSGAAMLGAFFIATDPVSAATTPRGRLYYGAGIGVLTFVIRTWGGYPDGVAFAVLLMNMAAPTIDYYTQPRVFGHGKE